MSQMDSILTADMFRAARGGEYVTGIILIKSYSIALTKNNREYISGMMQSGAEVPFKAWEKSVAFSKLKAEEYRNLVVMVSGKYDDYGGTISITLDDVYAVEGFDSVQFLPIKYDVEKYTEGLRGLLSSSASPKVLSLADQIIFSSTDVSERFKNEYAAMTHHDNCRSGLLAHTYKTVLLASIVPTLYPSIFVGDDGVRIQDKVDLLILATFLHDIGKTREMENGVYTEFSYVTHRFLGIEMIDKTLIISNYSEKFYYDLVSVLLQHHGEFGDPYKTVIAYMVHNLDLLESKLTFLNQTLENLPSRESTTAIKIDSTYLTL